MKISVITVCLNSEKTIEKTIQSVVSQENCDYEYIIVDGMSTDGTLEIIEKYRGKISVVMSEPDSGIYDAMNKGISMATGDIIGIINSDDWYEPGAFALVEKCFRDTNAEVVYGKMNLVDANGQIGVRIPGDIEEIRYIMKISHPTVFVKKSIYQEHGSFRLKYKLAADYELLLRFYTKGVKFQYLERILANFRLGGLSDRRAGECAREALEISSEYLPYAPLDKIQEVKENISREEKAYLFERILDDSPDALWGILKKEPGISSESNIAIFGAGKWGKKVYTALLHAGKQVAFLVDNDRGKWNQERDGAKVLNPAILKTFHGVLLVAVRGASDEISLQIDRLENPSLYCVYWEEISEISQNLETNTVIDER